MNREQTSSEPSDYLGLVFIFLLSLGLGLSIGLARMLDQAGEQETRQIVHIFFAGLLLPILLLYPNRGNLSFKIPSFLVISVDRLAIVFCVINTLLNLGLIWDQISPQLPSTELTTLGAVTVVVMLLVLLVSSLWIREVNSPTIIFYLSLVITVLLAYLWIRGIPSEALYGKGSSRVSELLDRFLIGAEPYLVIDTRLSDLFSLLPGFWFFLFPGWFLEVDLRWIHLLGSVLAGHLVFWGMRSGKERVSGYYLAVFMLTPFMVIGSDLYVGIILFVTALFSFFLYRRLYLFAAAVLGWGLASFLLLWLLVPFILVFVKREQKLLPWVFQLLVMILFTGLLMGPFWDSYSTILDLPTAGYWEDSVFWNSLNFGFLLEDLIGQYGLYFMQITGFIVLYSSYLRSSRSLSMSLLFVAITSFLLSILNRVVEPWYFIYIIFLLIVASTVHTGNEKKSFFLSPRSGIHR